MIETERQRKINRLATRERLRRKIMRLSYPCSLLAVGGCWATVVVAPGSCGEAAAVAVACQLEQLLLSLQRVEHLKAKLNVFKVEE
jgi:hypothetical protein